MNKYIGGIFILITAALSLWFVRYRSHNQIHTNLPAESTIIVGTNAEYPPFSTIENETITGFDIDLIHEIGKHLNKKIILKDMPFDALIPEMQLGHIAVIAAGMTATSEREKQMFFTQPYITGDPLVAITLGSKETPIQSVDDLRGKNIVVNEGYTADDYLSQYDDLIINRLATPAEAILALTSQRADIFVAALSSVKPFLSQEKNKTFVYFPLKNTSDSYALAVSKKMPDLFKEIDRAIHALQENGTIERLKKKWDI